MSSTNSPCAACKFLRRKCTQECIFAPYFPPDNPQRFACVHRVFGASNIGKILNDLSPCQREDAVTSLAFEAEARLDSPVYGCVRHIVILQQRLQQIQMDLLHAKSELSAYINPQGIQGPFSPHGIRGLPLYPQGKPPSSSAALFGPPYGPNVIQSLMPPSSVQHNGTMIANADLDPEQRELLEAQQLAAQQHDMMVRNYEHQHQQEYLRYNGATGIIEPVAAASPVSVVTADGDGRGSGVFAQMAAHSGAQGGELAPSLGLGTFDSGGTYHHQLQQQPPQHGGVGENYVGLANRHHYPVEAQFLLPSQQQQPLESEDCKRGIEFLLLQFQPPSPGNAFSLRVSVFAAAPANLPTALSAPCRCTRQPSHVLVCTLPSGASSDHLEYAEKDKKERRMSSTPTPCAACKFLRRKCTPECIFAPYFPANNPERFECVHRVFGASNVGKILNELPPSQREDAVKSLAFQAKARLRNPVYGCTFQVSILQQLLRQRRAVLENAKRELSAYINPQAIQGPFNPQEKPLSSSPAHLGPSCCSNIVQYSAHLNPFYDPNVVHSSVHLGLSDGPDDEPFFKPAIQYNGSLGGGGAVPQADPGQQELLEAQQLAAAVAFREQQLRYNAAAGIEPVAAAAPYGGNVSGSGVFGHMGAPSGGQGGEMAPCMGLGTFDSGESYHSQLQQPPQHGVGGNYVLATQHHYPLEGQLLLPSEHQALPLTLQQQQQLELQIIINSEKSVKLREAAYWSWILNNQLVDHTIW
ncbi:hypothetical protein Ahy_B01g052648 [Arachis hypogaea]|uniref:LOB domain-containing protein n=1 Tax=Arachis hypogaea TaxID=3818 RepID=A0A445AQ22_ARAHY|nr:hypothetical protein Ahy_B01g052648 [Arachis hypogaea]